MQSTKLWIQLSVPACCSGSYPTGFELHYEINRPMRYDHSQTLLNVLIVHLEITGGHFDYDQDNMFIFEFQKDKKADLRGTDFQ